MFWRAETFTCLGKFFFVYSIPSEGHRNMALVIICGQPCSGKSTAAACLMKALEKTINMPVVLIDEPSLNLDRNSAYQDMPREKNLRGMLRSAVDRAVSIDTIVIVDSLNNIKGYRYELWCLARAAGTHYCVLHCVADEAQCRAWNEDRRLKALPAYEDKIFNDLVRRFERPDGKNRWDSRLFELHLGKEDIHEDSQAIVEAVSFLTGNKNVGGSRNPQKLQPTIATQNPRTSETNSLYELDRATQEIVSIVVDAQAQGVGGLVRSVNLGEGLPIINLQRSVGLPELRRLRRTFLKLAGQSSLSGPPPPSDTKSAKRMFADYLNRELSANLL
ncbi:protein KTI12 homolog isoform X2 [Physcomitrium patens]|uniref:Protein KTI12 homolog n=1 Tax=Physcomitrium patens TaxID=3218 RepID=A0A7I3ZZA4_PHYPA|nr:protein KTI12 homolog isoform X1 [Physcomitrium patens]|eukprot:XP_024386539.1 protein KTI12 homolog isoform X1 [Physcomitrella patens]